MKDKLVKQKDPFKKILKKVENWGNIPRFKHKNPDTIWFPKAKSDLITYRMSLQHCCSAQSRNPKGDYFLENEESENLANLGAITRPGVGKDSTVAEYENEKTSNKPTVSSFRMANRVFRFLGFTMRYPTISNAYVVTPLGFQWAKFQGPYPSKIGSLSERDFLAERFANFIFFPPHDGPHTWDTRFANRLVVNILRCANKYGYISNNELVVTAFSLQKETQHEIQEMMDRLKRLHINKLTMKDAFTECSIDPDSKSVCEGVYDSPKVLLNIMREVGFLKSKSTLLSECPENIKRKYKKMYTTSRTPKNFLKKTDNVNFITDYGKQFLKKVEKLRVINFKDFILKTSFNIDDVVEEMALLVLLTQKQEKVSIKQLDINVPNNWSKVLQRLQKKTKIKVREKQGHLVLQTSVSFDLYQSIPSEFVEPVSNLVYKIIPNPEILSPSNIDGKIFVPKKIPKDTSYPCINCADAPCMEYSQQKNQFASTDELSSRVCPDDLISIDSKQYISIDSAKCTGCTLCVIRCPFNSILPNNGVVNLKQFSKDQIGKIVEEKTVKPAVKQNLTKQIIKKYKVKSSSILSNTDLCKKLDNFDTKMIQENWDQDPYYVWVRNVLRELGLEARYTGSPGKKKVADVTVVSPFFVGIEVKSPAESDVDIGAIRQALGAKSETASTFKQDFNDVLCAAIGQGIGQGAHQHTQTQLTQLKIKIPIITGRVLLYILLKHQTNLPQEPKDLKFLFENFSGEIGIDELKHYFEKFFKTHSKYEEYKEETFKEIEKCFRSKKQKARGHYSK